MATQTVTMTEKKENTIILKPKEKKVTFCLKVDNDSEEEDYFYQNTYFADIPSCPICDEYDCYKKECGDIIDEQLDRAEYWASN